MAGSNPAEAERAFYGPVIQSLRCIAEPELELWHRGSELDRSMLLARDLVLSGPSELLLNAWMHYDDVEVEGPAGPWRVTVREFLFEYETSGAELVYGYWYKRDETDVRSFVKVGENEHTFPVRRLTVEELVRLGIEYLGVTPQHPNWAEILGSNLQTHLDWRT